MPLHVALNHVTHYRYDRAIKLGPQVVRLRPAPHSRTKILSYALKVEPAEHFINWQQDPFANYLARLVFEKSTREFKVTVDLIAEMAVFDPFDFFLEPYAEEFPFSYDSAQCIELAPYLLTQAATPLLAAYLAKIDRKPKRLIDFLVHLNQQLHADVKYLIRLEHGVQTPEQTLALCSGSCRDSAWLLVQLLRHLGLAARFASGYLIQLKADMKAVDGPSGAETDFTDLHAWCEVYLPGAGWIGLDPTSGLLAGEGHIPLACTPQPSSAAPIEGALDRCVVSFTHHMQVTRVQESARVTLPYNDAQWQAIVALGDAVDADLKRGDVRLTMGGEPTFVASLDPDSPEWSTAALGPTKRGLGAQLLSRLQAHHSVGGFLHAGQGKWYPGEPLPRWALSLFWRTDGHTIWKNPALLADERSSTRSYSSEDALRLMQLLTTKLGICSEFITPAYEESWYYLWREGRLPINVDPLHSRLHDETERSQLRRIFSQGLDAIAGYVLPLHVAPTSKGKDLHTTWCTGPWLVREQRLHLLPGDSAMGYRLPLDSLPWVAPHDEELLHEADPFSPRKPLPEKPCEDKSTHEAHSSKEKDPKTLRTPEAQESAPWLKRTALCMQVRHVPDSDQHQALYVFLPPQERLEDYLALLAALEAAAQELQLPVVLEGYTPPRDPRLKMLQITPDPGVLEVNITPSSSWRELVSNTEFLYDAARHTGLTAEKFMMDGRHTGTGGGNHIVLGGATPEDSPFLRKPELLSSLLAYWHNHPSLSYLFSGLFIGPTSQAPRIDEARNDQLYELEIALQEIARAQQAHGEHMPPWLVDRSLRNILIDVTGNTHRSEFCIDKLYSPDTSTGRLGLLELRGFEMPPHERMSAVQQLLVRALLAHFWQTPYQIPLTRWGTQLHDRWMLPHFIEQDLADVIHDLDQAAYAFDSAWFAPHLEFRFPLMGQVTVAGITLTLRIALEPWHVLGESNTATGTARYVDSSLERLQVLVQGITDSRHIITVNGHTLALQPTGVAGEYVAGVRYKAWNPPSSLHPSIDTHGPLVFDVIDTWGQRSLGGCQYHVTHPGGRNYASLPLNAYEAQSRRLARFSQIGHTPGQVQVHPAKINAEFPHTLDLRQQKLLQTLPSKKAKKS